MCCAAVEANSEAEAAAVWLAASTACSEIEDLGLWCGSGQADGKVEVRTPMTPLTCGSLLYVSPQCCPQAMCANLMSGGNLETKSHHTVHCDLGSGVYCHLGMPASGGGSGVWRGAASL